MSSYTDTMFSPHEAPYEARLLCRQNRLTNTSGIAPGYVQVNLLVLPAQYAADFQDLCRRNPVSCPLLGTTATVGDPHSVQPAGCIQSDFDIRTDFPKYRVYSQGEYLETCCDLLEKWTSDHVGFLIGCSFSFEDALTAAGLQPRHQQTNSIVAMYRSNIPLMPAGIFTDARCIVSMRPYRPEHIERVREVTRPYHSTHGQPVAWGWEGAKQIGISDLDHPDFGDPQSFQEGEVPVFWACGVTPQMAVKSAGDKIDGLVFAHEPGHMLITDWIADDLLGLGQGNV